MALQLSLVDTHEKLIELEAEWNALAGDNPFLSWDWVETWWRHYQTPQTKLFVLTVRDELNRLVGIAPWKIRQTLTRGRVVHFIGSNEVCGDRLTIISRPDCRVEVLSRMVEYLTKENSTSWDLLELTGVESADADVLGVAKTFEDRGHSIHIRPDLNCWNIPLTNDWEKYLATLSRSRRNRSRRLLKNMISTGKACQRVVSSLDEFDLGFNVLVELHQKRRNMLGEPGCFASDRYHAFHVEFAKRMLQQNRLRLVWLEINGQPAATEYSILGDKKIYNYQSGFEPALADAHPGWLNLITTLRWAIEEGYQAFDMLRGDESYKASFGATASPLVQVRIAGHHNAARIRHAAWRTHATFKRWAREGLKLANDMRRTPSKPTIDEAEHANSTTGE